MAIIKITIYKNIYLFEKTKKQKKNNNNILLTVFTKIFMVSSKNILGKISFVGSLVNTSMRPLALLDTYGLVVQDRPKDLDYISKSIILGISLMCYSSFVLDVICSPRGLAVHFLSTAFAY